MRYLTQPTERKVISISALFVHSNKLHAFYCSIKISVLFNCLVCFQHSLSLIGLKVAAQLAIKHIFMQL